MLSGGFHIYISAGIIASSQSINVTYTGADVWALERAMISSFTRGTLLPFQLYFVHRFTNHTVPPFPNWNGVPPTNNPWCHAPIINMFEHSKIALTMPTDN
jgi:hypothetical protein